MNTLDALDAASLRTDIPDFRPGDTVKVHVKVIEGSRSRIQVFAGHVIRRQGGGIRETFTVRKISFGVGVERTFPVHSPKIERIEVTARGDVRRAKLYYLRDRVGKRARVRERRYVGPEDVVEPGLLHQEEPLVEAEPEGVDGDAPEAVVEAEALATEDAAAPEAAAQPPADEPEAEAAPADADGETPAADDQA